MTEDKENRLARWSRRKLAARTPEQEITTEDDARQSETVPNLPADDAGPSVDPAEPEVEEELQEPLPRIEDLTIESDLTAFLKRGVPAALKRAAMRKMWSIDPNIRDYVGPSEYAWDFNQPGSMPGFGPLEANKAVVGFLSRTASVLDTDEAADHTAPAAAETIDADSPGEAIPETAIDGQAGPQTVAAVPEVSPSNMVTQTAGDDTTTTAATDTPIPTSSMHPHKSRILEDKTPVGDERTTQEQDRDRQKTEAARRPRHGGALPRC